MRLHFPTQRKYRGLPLQLKYAMVLTVVSAFTALVTIFVMAWFIQRNYSLFMGDELGISAQVIEVVRHEQRLLEISLFVLFCFTITVMFATAFYVTRRLTGPIVALHRQLWLYSQGDWSRDFRLRNDDEFKEFEAILNTIRQSYLTRDGKTEQA
jgi:cytochrome b subunit of formate dehydrogenase